MTSSATKTEWLAILPDHENDPERRLSVRPKHFEGLKEGIDNGFWKSGGAILHEPEIEGKQLQFRGSVMVGLASSREEFIEVLKSDIYFKNDVWDWDKVQIYPFKNGFRIAP
ncbi:MAG: hypothetical protein M1814_005070 [Vezdaea aestivalis]|nr:MAG: hypothetical protein M1814_005070 [Vezdaea aestivalis]